jgi:hypothetical protein
MSDEFVTAIYNLKGQQVASFPVRLDEENASLQAEVQRLREDLENEKKDRAAEVDEFNAGYQAFDAGLDLDDAERQYRYALPDDVSSYDVFGCGYAWAKFLAEGKDK